jgi:hypothetical protein
VQRRSPAANTLEHAQIIAVTVFELGLGEKPPPRAGRDLAAQLLVAEQRVERGREAVRRRARTDTRSDRPRSARRYRAAALPTTGVPIAIDSITMQPNGSGSTDGATDTSTAA